MDGAGVPALSASRVSEKAPDLVGYNVARRKEALVFIWQIRLYCLIEKFISM